MTTSPPTVAAVQQHPHPPEPPGKPGLGSRASGLISNLLFGVLVYVPILLMAPGRVESDTKSYLYLDPGRLLDRASTIWTPDLGLGGPSHQTIGYLFPTGPYYWLMEQGLGVPSWIAQRLWLGTIIFLAGLGVQYMLRTLGVRGAGVTVAMVAYAFSPYVLGNSPQYSALLLPWAALPYWIAFMALALRRGGWKYPALFALVVQLTASLNATALIYALIGPALFLLYSLFVTRESTLRRTWSVVWRTGLLTTIVSLWWASSLSVEGKYALNILRFTESIEVVSITTLPFEILRGLGNWYFYGGDRNGLWSDARPFYTQRFWLIAISLLIPALAMLAAALMRWRYRAFFVMLVLVGVVIAVGASPYDDPSLLGGAYKEFALNSSFGFALRNTIRAVPLVALGLAVLLGMGVSSMLVSLRATRWRPYSYLAAGLVGVICLINAVPALTGNYYNKPLQRSEDVPKYWQDAVAYLDARPHDTRVLALPGTPFATYRWGDLKDPVEPGLMDRPFVDRELVPAGSEPAANLVQSFDHRLQEDDQRRFESAAVAPVARLMGVGDVELRMDLRTDQYQLVGAKSLWHMFTDPVPEGLGAPRTFGNKIPGRLHVPEAADLARPGPSPAPKPVAVFPVEDPLPIVRAKSERSAMIVDGDGEGIVDTAAAGLLDPERAIFYSAPFEHDAAKLRDLAPDATLIVTDSNRRRGTRWSGMSNNYGYTEQAGEDPLRHDPLDQRLEPFVGTSDASRTVTLLSGVKSVRATSYGSPSFNYLPEQRPSLALDGDLDTAWLVGSGDPVGDERLVIKLDHPITTDHLNLTQLSSVLWPLEPQDPRYITRVGLSFDDSPPVRRFLGPKSRTRAGQDVKFPQRTFSTVELRIEGVHGNHRLGAAARRNAVGINELRLTDDAPHAKPVRVEESQRVPTDLLDALGKQSDAHPLAFVLSREATMDGAQLNRTFSIPTARAFTLSGSASLSRDATDPAIDGGLGLAPATAGGITTTSSSHEHLDNPIARSSSAIDGDLGTAWVSQIRQVQPSLRVELPAPITLDRLDLQLVADGRHSLATRLKITGDDGEEHIVDLPVTSARPQPGGTLAVPVSFPPITGRAFTIQVMRTKVLERGGDGRPTGIAELGIPGVQRQPFADRLPGQCTSELVEVDGKPFAVRVSGATTDALEGRPLTLEPCDPNGSLGLAAGTHQIRARMSPKNPTGFDVDRIVLASDAGGAPIAATTLAAPGAREEATRPRVRVLKEDATSMSLQVDDATDPFWLVLGQSYNAGWTAEADGKKLAPPTLVDGYANGWRVEPTGRGPMTVTLEWTPERSFEIAIVISVIATLLCLGIVLAAFLLRGRRRRLAAIDPPVLPGPTLPSSLVTRALPRRRWATVATVTASGLATSLLIRPWVGIPVAGLVLLAIWSPKWRLVLRFAPPVIVLGIAAYISIGQRLHRYTASFEWPLRYDAASVPAWIAVALLAVDAVISMVWHAESEPQPDPD